MATRPGGIRTLVLALAAALVLFGGILTAFLLLSGASDREGITLPDLQQSAEMPAEGAVEEGTFLHVDAGNVAQVVATLARPASYHQSLSVLTAWPEDSAARTVEIWVSGGVTRVDVTDTRTTRSILTDGETAYVWYAGDAEATQFLLGDTLTVDSLTGIPTYERITQAGQEIVEAGFVQLDDMDGRSCIFAQLGDEDYVDCYWVDVATGLLCRATTSREQTLIYQLREETSEQLLATDEAFSTAFTLPDGTAPYFSEQ